MQTLIKQFKLKYGYEPTISELVSLYFQGELTLTDTQENELLKLINL